MNVFNKIFINIIIEDENIFKHDLITKTLLQLIKDYNLNNNPKWVKFKEIYEIKLKVFNTDSNIQKSNELDNYFKILYEMNLEDKIDLEEDNIGNSKNIKSNHLDTSEKKPIYNIF